MRLAGLALALAVASASPLHCLAEGLSKPAPPTPIVSADQGGRLPLAPGIRCASHCSSPKALLPSTNLRTASGGDRVRGDAYAIVWIRPSEFLLRTKFTIRVTGPPRGSSALTERNLPLLI